MYRSLITQWIRKLRSRRSQGGEFKYKPLLVLAVLEILDREPEHPNSWNNNTCHFDFSHVPCADPGLGQPDHS